MSTAASNPVALERHLSVAEVAQQWGVSRDTARRIFQDLSGVLRIGHRQTKHKRKYMTLRVPERIVREQHALRTREAIPISKPGTKTLAEKKAAMKQREVA